MSIAKFFSFLSVPFISSRVVVHQLRFQDIWQNELVQVFYHLIWFELNAVVYFHSSWSKYNIVVISKVVCFLESNTFVQVISIDEEDEWTKNWSLWNST